MKKSKHSDSEKVKAVKALEGGVVADVICREHGISRSTLYLWRSKYGGMEVNQVRRLHELEEENIDDFNRSSVAQEVAISIPAARLIRTLEKVIWTVGKPQNIRCDNGPEFIAGIFQEWCKANDINLLYTQPGCPTQNSFIERFNGSYRRAVLDAYLFRTLDDVRNITEIWKNDYNENRPHDSLGDMSPREYELHYLEKLTTFASPN